MLIDFLNCIFSIYEGKIPLHSIVEGQFEFKDGMSLFSIDFVDEDDCNVFFCKDTCDSKSCIELDNITLQKAATIFVADFLGKKR